ncbi:hypothetical protein ES703_66796 [subsurface metagenome]
MRAIFWLSEKTLVRYQGARPPRTAAQPLHLLAVRKISRQLPGGKAAGAAAAPGRRGRPKMPAAFTKVKVVSVGRHQKRERWLVVDLVNQSG